MEGGDESVWFPLMVVIVLPKVSGSESNHESGIYLYAPAKVATLATIPIKPVTNKFMYLLKD